MHGRIPSPGVIFARSGWQARRGSFRMPGTPATPRKLSTGGFIPPFGVSGWNMAVGLALSAFIGVASGCIPAFLASRLKIVDALRRVA